MPVLTYPGVYVQEMASGVRTIVGVGTSVGMFVGRAKKGELKKPTLCLSLDDFERSFSLDYAGSHLARAVALFFMNGGTQCYAMRIADSAAAAAEVTLLNELKQPTLRAIAKSAGHFGDDIRVSINYNTPQPEATFNMEVFRWVKTSAGSLQKTDVESYAGVSMDPAHARYVISQVGGKDGSGREVSGQSRLISLEDLNPAAVTGTAYSLSGFAISSGEGNAASLNSIFKDQWAAFLAKGRKFRISVAGATPVTVDLTGYSLPAAGVLNSVKAAVQTAINSQLSGATVTVDFKNGPAGPNGQSNKTTRMMIISSSEGDVFIDPASSDDLAATLMLGTAQGGIEVSRTALRRPAPNGVAFNLLKDLPTLDTLGDLCTFAQLPQDTLNALSVSGTEITLSGSTSLSTVTVPAVAEPRMYQDSGATNQDDGRKGLREKLATIARSINGARSLNPDFPWTAEVWGSRLALVPAAGSDNTTTDLIAGKRVAPAPAALPVVADAFGAPTRNMRYYALGTTGQGDYQNTAANPGKQGNDGGAPTLADYEEAYKIIDRKVDLFNLLVLPKDDSHSEETARTLWGPASVFCQKRRAFLLMDPPDSWKDAETAVDVTKGVNSLRVGLVKDYSALFFPRVRIIEGGKEVVTGPSGAMAGVMARIDGSRGVWKAPAGTEADIRGIVGVDCQFSDGENGVMNPKGINTIRIFPNGIVNWGARTMDGDDSFASEYKYIPIRRLALYMEESLYRGLKWVVFEPNDEPLWAQIRLNVGAFMHNLFRQGAFQGQTPRDAYFVRCDANTTTQNDRNLGIVNIMVGFAPLKPAEFVVLYLQQMAGQVQV